MNTGRIRAVGPPDEDHHIELRFRARLSRKVKITGFLLGCASVPGAVVTGAVPWGLRFAGIATQTDAKKLDEKIEAVASAQHTADALSAARNDEAKKDREAILGSLSALGGRLKMIDQRLRKRGAQ